MKSAFALPSVDDHHGHDFTVVFLVIISWRLFMVCSRSKILEETASLQRRAIEDVVEADYTPITRARLETETRRLQDEAAEALQESQVQRQPLPSRRIKPIRGTCNLAPPA